ncbi:MAG: segregation/condensation protein A [Chloroflexi bacterium]|nr:segregation/condensation protein A [Chloroflexota bacterium]MCI0578619.1 segregation/condensation protein A [Chloroflexota bacterium]MCI0647378.1 segregation/condensation protein A [Chloroflexota bacterium]MCI0727838.1 segregation/condensation protein A [Chloroflexota bacterium]
MPTPYHVELPVFTGPLDLLLHLIERNELDITAISLAVVTEQYLDQVKRLQEDKVDDLIDFLVIGARLVLIKSRALLPQTPELLPAGEEEEDPAEALAQQLRLYKQFKEAAAWLARRQEQGLRTYLRVAPPPKLEGKLDLGGVTVETLIASLRFALARAEKLEESVAVAVQHQAITIEQQMDRLRRRLKAGRVRFEELLSEQSSRVEVAVTLLAVLELIKRREVAAYQAALFGPIEIVPDNGPAPSP